MSEVVAVVLAAGRASRFGSPKQLALLDGVPLVVHAVRAAAPAGRVVVVVGANGDAVRAALAGEDAEVVVAEDWAEGLSASLRRGLEEVGPDASMLVLLADQPGVSAEVVERVLAAGRAAEDRAGEAVRAGETARAGEARLAGERDGGVDAVRASFGGKPAHPVLLRPSLFPALRALRGDGGAGPVLARAHVRLVPCDDLGTDRDVDTPADLDAF